MMDQQIIAERFVMKLQKEIHELPFTIKKMVGYQMLETTVLIKQLLTSLDLWIVMTMLMKICMKSYSQIF